MITLSALKTKNNGRWKTKDQIIFQDICYNQKFIVLSNELSGIQQRALNQKDALYEIDQINYTPIQRNINTILNWQHEISQKELNVNHNLKNFSYILLSDFQRDFFKLGNIKKDLKSKYNLLICIFSKVMIKCW